MAKRKKQREINIVSLSFLDVLSNTIGALAFLLLLLIIVITQMSAYMHLLTLEIVTDFELPDAQEGEFYSVAIAAKGGDEPYLWQHQGTLPEGFDFDLDKGIISGTPETGSITREETFTFTVQVSDSFKEKKSRVQKDFTLKVLPKPPITWEKVESNPVKIETETPLPNAMVGIEYQIALSAIGGLEPYKWSIQGDLPRGFNLRDDVLAGTPRTQGTATFTLKVVDTLSGSDIKEVSLEIEPAPIISPTEMAIVTIETESLPNAITNQEYALTLAAIGGNLPYEWSVSSGILPDGLSLEKNGKISGTPSRNETADFTIRVNSSGQSDSKTLSLVVEPKPVILPLAIQTEKIAGAIIDVPYQMTLAASGGIPPYTWSIVKGKLPKGLKLDEEKGGDITGKVKNVEEGVKYKFLVLVADAQEMPAKESKWLDITAYTAHQPEKVRRAIWITVLATIGVILLLFFAYGVYNNIKWRRRGYKPAWVKTSQGD